MKKLVEYTKILSDMSVITDEKLQSLASDIKTDGGILHWSAQMRLDPEQYSAVQC